MQQAPKSQHIPVEPVLELDEIQGACIPGFLKPYQSLIGVNSEDSLAGANELRHFIGLLSKEVATGRVTLKDRREHRTFKAKGEEGSKPPVALIGIGVSFVGLSKITPSAASIPSEAFRLGLATRSSLLGDPTAGKSEGAPGNWIVGGGRGELEALILVAGDTPDCIADGVCRVRKAIKSSRVIETYFEAGAVRSDMPGHEHFGFDDGVSQPGIRGRASKQATDFITERHVDKAAYPEHWLFGYPGQTLVWPGEFVLGYPVSSPDPLYPGPIAQPFPDWLRNGSYLVFRRLRQDVGLFGARCGRRQSGFPLIRDSGIFPMSSWHRGWWGVGRAALRSTAHRTKTFQSSAKRFSPIITSATIPTPSRYRLCMVTIAFRWRKLIRPG